MTSLLPGLLLGLLLGGCSDPVPGGSPDGGNDAALGQNGLFRTEVELALGAPLHFDVPVGALGVHVSVTGGADGDDLTFGTLVGPTGHAFIDGVIPEGGDTATDQGLNGATITLPMTSTMQQQPILPGAYTATIDGATAGPLQVTIAIQSTTDGVFHGGVLDLDLFIPDGLVLSQPSAAHAISAASAATDGDVAVRLDAFFTSAKALAGLERGEVRFHSIPQSFLSLDTSEQIAAAAKQTAVLTGDTPSARILWTNKLALGGQEIWGQSQGIPGAGARRGTPYSAVILEISSAFPPKGDGMTMLHELGHFAGLRHTTELGAGMVDWISDTAECPDGTFESYAACGDKKNLMFPIYWGATGGKNVELSDGQRRVIQASPIYRPLIPR